MKKIFVLCIISLLIVGCNVLNSCSKSGSDKSFELSEVNSVDSSSYSYPVEEAAESAPKEFFERKEVMESEGSFGEGGVSYGVGGVSKKAKKSRIRTMVNPVPVVSADTIKHIEKASDLGVIAYYVPDTMKVNVEYRATLRISKKCSQNIIVGFSDTSLVITKEIRVGDKMEVKLIETNSSVENFKITTLSSEVQNIENDTTYTTWEWSIRPTKSGVHKLKMIVVIKGDNFSKDIPVYENDIYIKSSPGFVIKTFLEKNWEWIMGTLVIPFIIFLWRSRKKKEEEN